MQETIVWYATKAMQHTMKSVNEFIEFSKTNVGKYSLVKYFNTLLPGVVAQSLKASIKTNIHEMFPDAPPISIDYMIAGLLYDVFGSEAGINTRDNLSDNHKSTADDLNKRLRIAVFKALITHLLMMAQEYPPKIVLVPKKPRMPVFSKRLGNKTI